MRRRRGVGERCKCPFENGMLLSGTRLACCRRDLNLFYLARLFTPVAGRKHIDRVFVSKLEELRPANVAVVGKHRGIHVGADKLIVRLNKTNGGSALRLLVFWLTRCFQVMVCAYLHCHRRTPRRFKPARLGLLWVVFYSSITWASPRERVSRTCLVLAEILNNESPPVYHTIASLFLFTCSAVVYS